MCANLHPIQRAVIRGAAMIGALRYAAVNALVCMTFFHDHVLLFVDSVLAFPVRRILCTSLLSLCFLRRVILLHHV